MITKNTETERSNNLDFNCKKIVEEQKKNLFIQDDDEDACKIKNISDLFIQDEVEESYELEDEEAEEELNNLVLKPKVRSLDDLAKIKMIEQTVNDTNESSANNKKHKSLKSIRKQIQFKIDSKNSDPAFKQDQKKTRHNSANVHEKLNQLKSDEIKKRRQSTFTTKSQTSNSDFLHLKLLNKNMKNLQLSVYNFFERPVGHKGLLYRLYIFSLILGSIVTGALTTVKSLDKWSLKLLFWYEIFVTSYFSLEYVLRVWSIGHRQSNKGLFGRIKFMLRPLQIAEITLIIISIIILTTGSSMRHLTDEIFFKSTALSFLRFFQIFRFLYIDRQAQTWVILSKVIKQHRFELLSSVYIGVIILLFSSYFILLFEKPYSERENDNHFHSYADAIYWSIITMATIGYGDRSPRTFAGKIISTSLCIIGVAFWTLPAGIIGSGFALKVEQKNKKKQFNRLIPAAASLIQAWWRMKATLFISSSNVSCLIATVSTFDITKPIYSTSLRRLKKHLDSVSSGNNDEINSYFSGLDRPGNSSKQNKNINSLGNKQKDYVLIENDLEKSLNDEKSKMLLQTSSQSESNYSQLNEESSILMKLSPEHLILIRTILLLKFFRAQHKFKLAFKPYDFKDVIEQYTQGNMDILLKMKDLQRKIDQVNSNALLSRSYYTENLFYNQNNNSPVIQRSNSSNSNQTQSRYGSPPSPNFIQKPPSPQLKLPQNYQYQDTLLAKNRRNSRRFITEPIFIDKNKNTVNNNNNNSNSASDLNQLNDRMNRIESELENLSKKLDKLINISIQNNNPNSLNSNLNSSSASTN